MSRRLNAQISRQLRDRLDVGKLRKLTVLDTAIDFCSNDYLGLARDSILAAAIRLARESNKTAPTGSTGSRLISGNSAAVESLENEIATFHGSESALLFSTGYAANTGLFECIVGAGDTIVTDRLIHASIIDGVRLSKARRLRFRHNDLTDLEAKLQQATGSIVIGVESVYSMDGDQAPLQEIVELADRFDAAVIVDEAHSVGINGPAGSGAVADLGLEDRVFARICTFGKALGSHGAAVVGSSALRDYLINYARSFIYSTALSPHSIDVIRTIYRRLPELDRRRESLRTQIDYFRRHAAATQMQWIDSATPIQSVIVPGNKEIRALADLVKSAGLGVVPIVSPTVPAGTERLRISVHAFNTHDDIDQLFDVLQRGAERWPDTLLQA